MVLEAQRRSGCLCFLLLKQAIRYQSRFSGSWCIRTIHSVLKTVCKPRFYDCVMHTTMSKTRMLCLHVPTTPGGISYSAWQKDLYFSKTISPARVFGLDSIWRLNDTWTKKKFALFLSSGFLCAAFWNVHADRPWPPLERKTWMHSKLHLLLGYKNPQRPRIAAYGGNFLPEGWLVGRRCFKSW